MDVEEREGSSDFGSLLRRFRLARGLSQQVLADRARLSLYGISALERGYRRTPQRGTLKQLAEALALNAEQRAAFESAANHPAVPRRRGSVAGGWSSNAPVNLPLALTRFIGRQAELDEIIALVRTHRFVTLTGAGGVGKTQTALRAVAGVVEATGSEVCLVALASATDLAQITMMVASAMGVQELHNRPLLTTLSEFLSGKTMLLLIDNCEHVIAEAAVVVDSLLHASSGLRVLATSRQAFKAAGECAYRLPSLGETEAMALFVDRARAVNFNFGLTDQNSSLVAGVCKRLDGIPLAIELAASLMNVVTLKTLASKLGNRLAILNRGERTAPPRQQTMRATIGWSYDLLSPPEQRLFMRLSVFAGDCTLDAVGCVCVDDEVADILFDTLGRLVDKSLVSVRIDEPEPRYSLLESFREYARERLSEYGESQTLAKRHARWCLETIGRFKAEPLAAWVQGWLIDCRAALQWALVEGGDVSLGQELVGELAAVWARAPAEGRHWLAIANRTVDERTPKKIVGMLRFAEAVVASQCGDYETQLSCSEEAIVLWRGVDEKKLAACAQRAAGGALCKLGRLSESETLLEEAFQSLRGLGDRFFAATVLGKLAESKAYAGKIDEARDCIAAAVETFQEFGDQRSVAAAIMDLGEFEALAGNHEASVAHSQRALEMSRASSDTIVIVSCLAAAAVSLARLNRYGEAEECAREAFALACEHRLTFQAVEALRRLGLIAACREGTVAGSGRIRAKAAARILGFVSAYFERRGLNIPETEAPLDKIAFAELTETIGADELAQFLKEGGAMTEERAFGEASSL